METQMTLRPPSCATPPYIRLTATAQQQEGRTPHYG